MYIYKFIILLGVSGFVSAAAEKACERMPDYCGPFINLEQCQVCCAKQFPRDYAACVQWCFGGKLPNKRS